MNSNTGWPRSKLCGPAGSLGHPGSVRLGLGAATGRLGRRRTEAARAGAAPGAAHLGRFKPLADFDWGWPAQCDQAVVAELMTLGFIREAANLILVGPNGVGKSMIAQNIAHHAVLRGTAPCSSMPPRCWEIWRRRTGTTPCDAA